jgi:ubiquinol-cytochrome c reductase cytochrome c1 subunit
MMMRYLFFIFFILFSSPLWAEDVPYIDQLQLATAPIDRNDMASIKRGASFFATNCMTCHTLVYLRYDKVAEEAGITYDKMPLNVKSWPFGITPPDLSLEASVRGTDWIYTYLHSFYLDPSRPTGVNNLLVHNTAMPDILRPYQGEQILANNPEPDLFGNIQWYTLLVLTKQGTMTPEQFDTTTADVVNFLAYAAEPYRQEQHRIGGWVLGFLVILFVLMYCLKREYWKDVKENKNNMI